MSDRLAVLPQYLLPKQALTQLAGAVARRQGGAFTTALIRRFVARYGVNMAEAADPRIEAYASFNDFFTRALKPGARPLADADAFVLSPADGAVSQVVEFFGKLAELSGNRVLQLAMQPVTRLLAPSLRRMIDRVPQGRSRIVVAQRCIVVALRKGDADEAESWMTRHVQDFRRGYEIAGIALDTRVA